MITPERLEEMKARIRYCPDNHECETYTCAVCNTDRRDAITEVERLQALVDEIKGILDIEEDILFESINKLREQNCLLTAALDAEEELTVFELSSDLTIPDDVVIRTHRELVAKLNAARIAAGRKPL